MRAWYTQKGLARTETGISWGPDLKNSVCFAKEFGLDPGDSKDLLKDFDHFSQQL